MRSVMRLLCELFPRWDANASEARLWADALGCYPEQVAIAAVREHRRRNQWNVPVLGEVDAIAKEAMMQARPGRFDAADYAREWDHIRQEDAAARKALDDEDPSLVAKAKDWLDRISLRAREDGRVDPIGASIQINPRTAVWFMLLAIRHRLWDRGERWWEALQTHGGVDRCGTGPSDLP